MTREEYLDALLALPSMGWGGPIISRDGRWAAWTWLGLGPTADVYAVPTDGSGPPLRLTDTADNTVAVSWTPDNQTVLVAQDHEGDERGRLYRVDLARPGVLVPLTEEQPNYFLRGGQLHPNGRWLVYGANLDPATGAEIAPTYVIRHDLTTGERVALARPVEPGFLTPAMNEQGTHILYARQDRHPAGTQVWLVDIEGREDREVLNVGDTAKVSARWFPDGRRALVRAEHGTYRRLGVWDRADGALRWLIDDPARNLEGAFVPHGTDGTVAVVIEVRDARSRASLLHLDSGVETPLPDLPGTLIPQHPLGGDTWVGTYANAQQPADVVRFHLDDPRPAALTSLTRVWSHTPLRPADLAPAEDFHWQSVDGLAIQGWLYRAQGEARGTVVYIHGGPTAHSEDRLNAEIAFFVSEGFHVLDPNYRGSTGFGLAFQETIKEDGWGGREQDDIRAGIAALIAAGIAQPGRVGTTGTSYGGYSSWCAITRWPPEVMAASAPVCGMTDLVVDYETTRPDLRPYSEEMLGGRPDQVPDRYRERSPIHFVTNIRGRLLIVQGMQDPNVTPENVRAVQSALDAAGIPYELLPFADEGHGIQRRANRRTLYLRLADFFAAAFAAALS